MSNVFKTNNKTNSNYNSNVIDQHLFCESFVLIANDLKFNFNNPLTIFNKITFLLDIMNESNGFVKARERKPSIKRYNLVQKLREKYPDFFFHDNEG